MSSPLSVYATISSKRDIRLLFPLFFPFSAVHIFRYYLYLHNFHVRWRITSGTGTASPFARHELSPGCVKGSYWYIFIYVWLYFVDHFLYFCPFSFANCIQCTSLIDCFWLHLVIFSRHFSAINKRWQHDNVWYINIWNSTYIV